jgi:hypothetical protein
MSDKAEKPTAELGVSESEKHGGPEPTPEPDAQRHPNYGCAGAFHSRGRKPCDNAPHNTIPGPLSNSE